MIVKEIEAKTILRKNKKIDSWFISQYGMNLYRGCSHDCTYCDGRAEKYQVEGNFGKEVAVKVNAIDILKRELDPSRKRKPFKRGFFVVGGGVCDSYQPVENKYQLTRKALRLLNHYNFPVHMLTKSILIKKDLDLLKKINIQSRVLVSMSFSSMNDKISAMFEPGVPAPSARLNILKELKKEGLACGIFMLPVIPSITDTEELMEETISKATEAGLDYLIFGGMTLKEGRQQNHFFNALQNYDPSLIKKYQEIYRGDQWGSATGKYYDSINRKFNIISKKHKIPKRIPLRLFKDILDENDLVVVLLEHIDYFLKLKGEKSSHGYAAYMLSKQKEPLSVLRGTLRKIKGVSFATERIIHEILDTGSSTLYENLSKS